MTDNRSHLEEKYTWDLSTIFATDAAWETEADSLSAAIEAARQQAGHLLDSSSSLLDITELQLELARRVEKLYVYASMKNDQDTTVAKYQEYQAKASGIYAKFSEAFSFYEPEFMDLTQETYQAFLAETPELTVYDHFFDKLFKTREHVLSQAEEELLAGAQEIFNGAEETFSILDNADIAFPIVTNDKGEEVELTHGNFISLMESKDRKVRRAAYEAMYSTYEQFQHTYAKTLQTNVRCKIIRHVFTNMLQPVRQRCQPTLSQRLFTIPY